MAELPEATVSIDPESGPAALGIDYVTIIAAVATAADAVPRLFSSTKALLSKHGYADGVDYASLHFARSRKPVVFVGIPIDTAGYVSQQDRTGVTGSCSIFATGTPMSQCDVILRVSTGGTVGTDAIVLDLSCDGGVKFKKVRLGTATSYTVPYFGIEFAFSEGHTLVAGDTFTCRTTAPVGDEDGWADAHQALTETIKPSRSWVFFDDLSEEDQATSVLTEVNGYETADKRFVYARVNARDSYPAAKMRRERARMTGTPSLSFLEVGGTGDTITRDTGSWLDDGFQIGDTITVTGSVSNNVTGPIANLSDTVITLGTTDLVNETTAAATVVASMTLTFAEVGGTGDTITRSRGSWIEDGFKIGDVITVTGSVSNNVSGALANVSATVLTFGSTDLADETIGSYAVSITAPAESITDWKTDILTEFQDVAQQLRLDIAGGRTRKISPITGYAMRRPIMWDASIREYEHDVHIPNWRRADGPLDNSDLEDTDGNVVEYDQRTDGGLLEGGFTCATTDQNESGTFIAMSVTRDDDGSLLSRTHNVAVANVGCTVVQRETTRMIGTVLKLNSDGTGTEASLRSLEEKVNTQLEIALLQPGREGERASSAKWVAHRNDVLNIAGAELNGDLELLLNGTLEKIRTRVRVQTGG